MGTLGLLLQPEGHLRLTVVAADMAEEIVEDIPAPDYEVAFARLHRRAYDVAFKLLGSRAEAEDVAQEALARAFVHWPKVQGYAEPWTVRVAANLAVGTWRKRRRLTALDDHAIDDHALAGGGNSHPQHAVADHLELRRALARLSRRQREVVALRHLAGFSERETAQALGCSDGTVKQHSSRGLAALRRLMDVPEPGPSGRGSGEPGPSGRGSGEPGPERPPEPGVIDLRPAPAPTRGSSSRPGRRRVGP